MRMFGRAMLALPVAGVLLAGLAGCGGGSVTQSDRQAGQIGQGGSVGNPPPVALAMNDFQAMARDAACTEQRNRLFIIDGRQVLWDHAGRCADASYGQVLYGASPDAVLCTSGDTIAGPRTTCQDPAARTMFETIVNNLDKADLGLGGAHTVERVDVLPKAGTELPFERVAMDSYSGVTQRKNVVIKDEAAWARLWAEHSAGRTPAPALPKVDFTNRMLVGVFLGDTGNCRTVAIPHVVAGAASIRVEVDERALQTFDACPAVVTQPMQVVAIDRSDIPVEFVPVAGAALRFQTLSQTSLSGVHEARTVVVKDAQAWRTLWQEHAADTPVPPVDFDNTMVVGVFLGSANPCYSTTIDSVTRKADRITVVKLEKMPPPGVMCAMLATSPAHLVAIERSELAVEFATEITQGK